MKSAFSSHEEDTGDLKQGHNRLCVGAGLFQTRAASKAMALPALMASPEPLEPSTSQTPRGCRSIRNAWHSFRSCCEQLDVLRPGLRIWISIYRQGGAAAVKHLHYPWSSCRSVFSAGSGLGFKATCKVMPE